VKQRGDGQCSDYQEDQDGTGDVEMSGGVTYTQQLNKMFGPSAPSYEWLEEAGNGCQ
jgi:hypothetical protein